jgi:hypothetical protein
LLVEGTVGLLAAPLVAPVAVGMLIYGAADLTFGISESVDKNSAGIKLFSYN